MLKLTSFTLGISCVILVGAAASIPAKNETIYPPTDSYNDYNHFNKFSFNEIKETNNIVEETHTSPQGRWVWAKVTAYTPGPESCGPYADGKTSIGVNTRSHNPNHVYGIAANPRLIPYGTKIYVEDYWHMLQNNINLKPTEMTEVDDTGSDMRNFRPHWRTIEGNRRYIEAHIDVRVRQVSTARKWGVRYIPIFLYE
jgi:3D (Asp-Asp-Asp) domain-containing protein